MLQWTKKTKNSTDSWEFKYNQLINTIRINDYKKPKKQSFIVERLIAKKIVFVIFRRSTKNRRKWRQNRNEKLELKIWKLVEINF